MTRRTYLAIIFLFSIAFATEILPALGVEVIQEIQEVTPEEASSEEASRMVLSVYLDGTGKALVTGYVENPEELTFLNSSQYSYENDTRQLYALTNALTRKNGEIWSILFESSGYYEDYGVTFYLPSDFTVKNVSSSRGLEHLFSASNDSLALAFQGYEVFNPMASIEYQQPLDVGSPRYPPPSFQLPLLLVLLLAASATAIFILRYRARAPRETAPSGEDIKSAIRAEELDISPKAATSQNSAGLSSNPIEGQEERDAPSGVGMDADDEDSEEEDENAGEDSVVKAGIPPVNSSADKIEISSEMSAVMETLTPRERAVLQALIDRGGRSTQADLRYETRTPKSSLTGIIYSLERRKLVTKKEWGRTNVIELSEWFLSKKGRS